MILALLGCAPKVLPPAGDVSIDVAVVPGCPAEDDGALSFCQWRRAIWAAHLYDEQLVDRFIVSGAAVKNPYPEWDGLRQGMVALGVPAERILTETQALHTDENLGYSWAIARDQGLDVIAVASDASHVETACRLLEKWDMECLGFPADYDVVHAVRMDVPVPAVEVATDPAWVRLAERERALAREAGKRKKRANSGWVYATAGFRSMPEPRVPEPSLSR
ncbi:MAG: YdcF family protein [Proteobacteria bacterium]|nr:YdcF family protein [Pseudomonadota bacterium]MCP4918583.1 YdcF family protein [Pseudomonadota bacterium]